MIKNKKFIKNIKSSNRKELEDKIKKSQHIISSKKIIHHQHIYKKKIHHPIQRKCIIPNLIVTIQTLLYIIHRYYTFIKKHNKILNIYC